MLLLAGEAKAVENRRETVVGEGGNGKAPPAYGVACATPPSKGVGVTDRADGSPGALSTTHKTKRKQG